MNQLEQYVKILETKVSELEEDKKLLKPFVDGLYVEGPNKFNEIYLKLEHKDLLGSFALRLDPNTMVGKTALEYGEKLQDAKRNVRA